MFTAIKHNDFETVAKLAPEHWNDREEGLTPLNYACRIYSVQSIAILALYGNLNEIDEIGYTPLKRMVVFNQAKEVESLLEHGADPNINDILYTACVRKNNQIITLLLKYGANPNVRLPAGQSKSILDLALTAEHIPLIKILLQYEAQSIDPVSLNNAIAHGNVEIIELLLDHNYHFTCDHLYKAIEHHNEIITGLLLNKDTSFKNEALHRACARNNIGIINLILNYDVDVNFLNNKDQSPIFTVHEESILKLLLSKGANLNHKDYQGNTPLHYTIQNMKFTLTKILLSLGADLYILNNKGLTPKDMINFWEFDEDDSDDEDDEDENAERLEFMNLFKELITSYEFDDIKEVGYN
jgi:ankyrin repeat protein